MFKKNYNHFQNNHYRNIEFPHLVTNTSKELQFLMSIFGALMKLEPYENFQKLYRHNVSFVLNGFPFSTIKILRIKHSFIECRTHGQIYFIRAEKQYIVFF